jgi:hypothetical protein
MLLSLQKKALTQTIPGKSFEETHDFNHFEKNFV